MTTPHPHPVAPYRGITVTVTRHANGRGWNVTAALPFACHTVWYRFAPTAADRQAVAEKFAKLLNA